ncbi:MAG: hypothetical protein ACREC6_11630 [Hyphomicrobiaceae bacterium]
MQMFVSNSKSRRLTMAAIVTAGAVALLSAPSHQARAMPLAAVDPAATQQAGADPVVHKVATYVYRRRVVGGKIVRRAGRLYDKSPDRVQVIVNGRRVPRKVGGGPVVRDHRR